MMKRIWEENFKIASYHSDFMGRIKPSALMQFFQETAGNHAAALGAGYELLQNQNLFWALSRLRVEVDRWPGWHEEISISTWPCGLEGPLFRRDFLIRDAANAVIGRGTSGWLLLDQSSMRPQRADRLGFELPLNEERAFGMFPPRLQTITGEEVFTKRVLYNEIDVNHHVNNTRYLDWVMDCFDKEHFQTFTLSGFQLEFLSETHWGDQVKLCLTPVSTSHFQVEAIGLLTGKPAFKAETHWR